MRRAGSATLPRLALLLVPFSWRESIQRDLEDEAAAAGRHGWRRTVWCAWHAARLGLQLRSSIDGDAVMSDVRYAVRSLVASRWFSAGAVLTFALGIGVNVAVFSAVDRLLFRPLPYPHPEQLYLLEEVTTATGQNYATLPAVCVTQARQLAEVLGVAATNVRASDYWLSSDPAETSPVLLDAATYGLTSVLAVMPAIGRGFTEGDARSQQHVVMLAYETWRSRFAGREDIAALKLWQNGKPWDIVGVLPEGFILPGQSLDARSEGFRLDPDLLTTTSPQARGRAPLLRLAPGVDPARIEAELAPSYANWQRQQPPLPAGRTPAPSSLRLTPLDRVMLSYYRPYLWLVIAAAALVLLIACANLASLLLVRGRSREHQAAVRAALGASAGRLALAALVEALLLSAGGAAIGVGILAWTGQALRAILPPVFSRYSSSFGDVRVMIFAITAATLCAVLAGVWPSLRTARVDVLSVLQQTGSRGRAGRLRGGASLLVIETAVGLALVMAAATTARSLIGLARTDIGFRLDDLYTIDVALPRIENEQTRYQQFLRVLEAMRTLPGVTRAGAVDVPPVIGAVGNRFGAGIEARDAFRWQVSDAFFETMGMRVIAGRTISSQDVSNHASVGVLSESGARLVWPELPTASAVGRFLTFDGEAPREVIGVVSDVRDTYADTPYQSLYIPVESARLRSLTVMARMAPGTAPSAATIRDRIRDAMTTPISVSVRSMPERFRVSLQDQRFRTVLFTTFGVVGLILSAVGLYAVVSFETASRQTELGVRASLGATPGRLHRMVLIEAIRPVGVGIAAGLAIAYWAATFLQSFLVKVDARDGLTFAGVALTLAATAVLAAWLPARRAARTDPAVVLRAQ